MLSRDHFTSMRIGPAQLGREGGFLRFNAVPALNGAFLAGDVTQRKDLEQHRVFNQNESVH